MRERVQSRAAQMRLRGARRLVMAAVLTMLCEKWSKIADDKMRLAQLVNVIAEGGGRRYDLKTVGRALSSLAVDEFIVYRPAQGRGARAFIAIHEQFVGDVDVLERDQFGRVIADHSDRSQADSVTFSDARPYTDQKNYLPTLRNGRQSGASRPTEVRVVQGELKTIMDGLAPPMASLPKHLRWKLGSEILRRLKRGWRADQLLDVLNAEMPAAVQRPYKLAVWRLQRNVVGSGPQLRPLQQAWDAQAAAEARAAAEDAKTRRFTDLAALTSAEVRRKALQASEVTFKQAVTDPMAALAVVARRASAAFPQLPVAEALARWSDDVLSSTVFEPKCVEQQLIPAPTSLSADLLMDLAISDGCSCVMCGSDRGVYRPELPLKSMATVCDRCWPHIAADLAADTDELELGEEAIPA
ncbi:hypothetical protein [Mycolicibacterium neoaurum]|uniref:hypothetical protein n=1 Tax=Mycolicibacterium neoaurum TaxID=1795 RepID=UPI001F4C5BDF|nr:hypothetical protein [Mycolicibacterium neoaurum]